MLSWVLQAREDKEEKAVLIGFLLEETARKKRRKNEGTVEAKVSNNRKTRCSDEVEQCTGEGRGLHTCRSCCGRLE
jgi:hypothetical protein